MNTSSAHANHVTISANRNEPKVYVVADNREYIPTRDAMPILNVTTTQGVWHVITLAERKHGFIVRKQNIGTDTMPRYLVNREDIVTVAELMGKL